MRDLFEMCGECRHLSDSEVIYQLTNNKETANEVGEMFYRGDDLNIEDICDKLTPARREMALAVIELYKRIQERKTKRITIRCSLDIYNVLKPFLSDLRVEETWVIFLNQSCKIIRKQRVSVGGISSALVDVRVILCEALKCNATTMILCHNHPSGNTQPSREDDNLTESLKKAGKTVNIHLLDHLIFTDNGYYSYNDEGRL